MANVLPTQLLLFFAFTLSMISPLFRTGALNGGGGGGGGGFTASLIHRNSPESPYYDPSESHYDRLAKALRRSIARSHRLMPSAAKGQKKKTALRGRPTTQITNNGGDYLVRVSLGTDPVEIVAVADTSNDLIWTQCSPCSDCYTQSSPFFDPSNSSTYQPIKCDSSDCELAVGGTCAGPGDDACHYSVFSGVKYENSYSHGVLAKENLALGSTKLRKITVGCGHKNQLMYDDDNAEGMMGLGRGPISLVSQIHDQIDGKFAYCLGLNNSGTGNGNNSSKIIFGRHADVPGAGAVSTSMVSGKFKSSYYAKLEKISVGNETVKSKNLVLLDTATLLTFVPRDLHSTLEAAVAGGASNLTPAEDPYGLFNLCYKVRGEVDLAGAPEFTMHFAGADVKLSSENMFLKVTDSVACLALVPIDGPEIIYGNLAQANHVVGFDLKKGTVSFKPTDCALI
ncbi:aspartic proteinase CDR1-like [Malania oleifera]|uniref:aspartic proteinase CDR1-like n=1 Tax=Malania oleifera TaxID=397392 RepID=UPI0025AD9FA4|nr:aspartic proteinase CDR1-like [Malania oleifera]